MTLDLRPPGPAAGRPLQGCGEAQVEEELHTRGGGQLKLLPTFC